MDLQSIRDALRYEPFRPFELCLADGRRVPVKHPEFVALNPRTVVVLDGTTPRRFAVQSGGSG